MSSREGRWSVSVDSAGGQQETGKLRGKKASRQNEPVWQTAAVTAAAMREKDVNCLVGLFSGKGERRGIYFATGLHH